MIDSAVLDMGDSVHDMSDQLDNFQEHELQTYAGSSVFWVITHDLERTAGRIPQGCLQQLPRDELSNTVMVSG